MKAIVFDTTGNPEDVLRVRAIDVPHPARGEVLVQIAARPIQPADAVLIDAAQDAAGLAERILGATGGMPVAALLDAVGGTALTRVLPALKPGGNIVSYGLLGSEPAQMANADMIYRNLHWQGFGVDHWLAQAGEQQRARMVQALWPAIAEKSIVLPVSARYVLDRAVKAIDAARVNPGAGKVLLCSLRP